MSLDQLGSWNLESAEWIIQWQRHIHLSPPSWRKNVTCRKDHNTNHWMKLFMNWSKRFESPLWIKIPIRKCTSKSCSPYILSASWLSDQAGKGSRSCARRWLALCFALLWSRAWQRALPSMRRGVRLRHSQDDRLWGAAFRRGEGKNKTLN